MAKNRRGSNIRNLPASGRGTCPICKRTGIKLLWEWKDKDDNTVNVCKNCRKRDPQSV